MIFKFQNKRSNYCCQARKLEVEKAGRLHNIFSHSQEGRSPGEHHSRKSTEEKVEKDVLIATLSSDTIRWIKRRRMFEAKHRVAITHFRESQLREIFVDPSLQLQVELTGLPSEPPRRRHPYHSSYSSWHRACRWCWLKRTRFIWNWRRGLEKRGGLLMRRCSAILRLVISTLESCMRNSKCHSLYVVLCQVDSFFLNNALTMLIIVICYST